MKGHLVLLLGLGVIASPVLAQREPVFSQIRVPHSYYFREMYLPQLTTGPSSATWSPDGQALIYSMGGSLWRQRIGSGRAEQITAGDGYDYQPDWSPDGRSVVYVSYRGHALGLWLLDLATLVSRPLLEDSAVNVEPRWSPDGTRIAYVSTRHEGRWHVFVARLANGRVAGTTRITEDRDSGLPRYYYSAFDHYLSPSWSPDGEEILLVSNRGSVWGTGGFWRMPARAGGTLRSVHHEETTWKARPDWGPDGRRIIYSSYLGRQWNQLWLVPADGGDAFQLTYGDHDATAPRWSPAGRHIAYVSNEGGNTSLWVLQVPGGARTRVVPETLAYRVPTGQLRITVTGPAGLPMPARVSLRLEDGRSAAPPDAWHHADDGFNPAARRMEYGYFHIPGSSTLTLPAGVVSVEISRGPEFKVFRTTVRVGPARAVTVNAPMERLADLASQGWTSGDLHVHMNYGGSYRATPASLALQARAEGLHVVENLIVNKEGRIPDIAYFTGSLDSVSGPDLLVAHDQEYHTSFWGHAGILGLTRNLLLPDYAGYVNTAAASLYPDNATASDLARAQGALFGYVHPFDELPDPARVEVPLTNALPVDAALGKLDYYEVMGFSDHFSTARVWYRLLNTGFRIPAGAGTDAMTNYASLRGPLGTTRVYVKSALPLDYRRWLEGLRSGRTFVTNGPLLTFAAEGTDIGGEIRLERPRRVRFDVSLRSIVPVDHLEIVRNGEVAARIPLGGSRSRIDTSLALPVRESGWYTLRAWSERPAEPILDIHPFATTSPIYILLGNRPIRSRRDAEFFIAWIDRLEEAARAHAGWNTEAEKAVVLHHIDQARREFVRRREERESQ